MLDLVLGDSAAAMGIKALRSHRQAALGTDHFLLTFCVAMPCPSPKRERLSARRNREALHDPAIKQSFAKAFSQSFEAKSTTRNSTLEETCTATITALKEAESTLLPWHSVPNKPWISADTLAIIERRREARALNLFIEERRLHKLVRSMAKKDRTAWMERLLDEGSWEQIRRIRKPKKPRQGKLRDGQGVLVDSDEWAETMAVHLEAVQWCVRPATLIEGRTLGDELPAYTAYFACEESARS